MCLCLCSVLNLVLSVFGNIELRFLHISFAAAPTVSVIVVVQVAAVVDAMFFLGSVLLLQEGHEL